MRKNLKRWLAGLLTTVMLAGVLPAASWAALLDNDPGYNREILSALKEIVGSEEEAERYYALLQKYGLLDEDGNAVESWSIIMDGAEVTLADLRAALAGDYDPDQAVIVDGQLLTLGDVDVILQIEDYLAYLRETYFSGHRWTEEQLANLNSLVEQINARGIQTLSGGSGPMGLSGVDHSARVSLSAPRISGQTAVVTATLTGAAAGQNVTFRWEALSGSQTVSGTTSGELTLTADAPSQNITVQLDEMSTEGDDPVRSTAGLTWYLKLDNIQNALFSNDSEAMTQKYEGGGTVETLPSPTFYVRGTGSVSTDEWGYYIYEPVELELNPDQKNALAWGITDSVKVSTDISVGRNSIEAGYYTSSGPDKKPIPETFGGFVMEGGEAWLDLFSFGIRAEMGNSSWGGTYGWTNRSDSVREIKSNTLVTDCFPFTDVKDWEDLGQPQVVDTITLTGEQSRFFSGQLSFDGSTYGLEAVGMGIGNRPESLMTTAAFDNRKAPQVVEDRITAPAGIYYPGQVVPVRVVFSEPVNAATAVVKFNGDTREYPAAEGSGYSNVLTFPYAVQESDGTSLSISSASAADTGGNQLTGYNLGGDVQTGQALPGVRLVTPMKAHAITNVTARVDSVDLTAPRLVVGVSVSNNEALTDWLAEAVASDGEGALYIDPEVLSVSIDGGVTKAPLSLPDGGAVTGQTLTATFPLELNTGTEAQNYVAELYLDNTLVVGKAAETALAAVKFITEDNLSAAIAITAIGEGGDPFENPEDPVIYVQSGMPSIQAGFTLTGTGYAFGNRAKTAAAGTADVETADFVWASSDTDVALIDKDGRITATGKAGTAQITLTARNGGVEGKAVVVTATYTVGEKNWDTLKFSAGLTPFLSIPNNELTAADGQDVTVYWSSNLCDKNGAEETVFTVSVKRDNDPVDLNGNGKGNDLTVTGTAEKPAASVTIPGDFLKYDYNSGGMNTFTVTVSAEYGGKRYSDTAVISLEALPAQVSLDKLDSYYILDTAGSVKIGWSVEHLDRAGDRDLRDCFKFRITKGSEEVDTGGVPELNNGSASGTFALTGLGFDADPNDPAGYRQVYTVTLQAKNGADSTWSYDSFLLYVYDADALQIMVDGAAARDGLTMSNRGNISQMSQEEILALKRDIYLKKIISVNYGTYAWTEVADQIQWASEHSATASLNYQQGTLYENIKKFSYTSYRPTTDLGLSGLSDGSTKITVTHKLTGMRDSLDVTVETLKDRLYLFQCYPQTEAKLTFEEYTNAAKTGTKHVTITSDNTGAAACYAEYGIASDVYCEATQDGTLYVGTFYLDQLKTGEGDWTRLERYPCNNLVLRRAAYAYIYLKNPDGTPYTGEVVFRGGVYVNGTYKESAMFGLNSTTVDTTGNQDARVNLDNKDKDGRLTVIMDQTQWNLNGGAVNRGDQVEYVFQLETADAKYYPILYTIDATANEDDYVGSGEAVVTFRENPEKVEHPFISAQAAYYSGYGRASSVLGSTGRVGPNDNLPEAELVTVVMWWGEELKEAPQNALRLYLDGSRIPVSDGAGEYELSNTAYPFSDCVITSYTVKLNEASLAGVVESGKDAGLVLEYYRDGSTLTRQEDLSFRLCNMLGMSKVEAQLLPQIQTLGSFAGTSAKDANNMDFGDEFIKIALQLVSSDSYTTGDDKLFSIQLAPTDDPTKFLGFIEVNIGNMSDKDQVTGVYAGTNTSGKSDFDYSPGLSELLTLTGKKSVYNYLLEDANKVLKRKGVRNISFDLGGYAESLIYYDAASRGWKLQILSGGFNAGGGVSYTWNWNTLVGIVPFTASLSIGGTAEVSMDTLTVGYWNSFNKSHGLGNDFLTELRIYLYLRFFAGVGFDYSIIAFKLGLYGQINVDMQFQWLNRPYMEADDSILNMADGRGDGNLNGQRFKIDGQIGLEFVVRFLFISYEKILYSLNFTLLDKTTGQWEAIQNSWAANQAAHSELIGALLTNGGLSLQNVGGQQMLSLNLAPTLEDRSYLEEGRRRWGPGIQLFSLDGENGLKNLEENTYPYANPVVSDDGQLVVYLSDQGSEEVGATRAACAVKGGSSYTRPSVIHDSGFGDSQAVLSGTEDFAVAAWTRQTVDIAKDQSAVLTAEDQMMMTNGTEICASVYNNNDWSTTRLSDNSAPDLAPAAAASGNRAIVAWRSVASSSVKELTRFDQKDTIVFKLWNGSGWSAVPITLYNGTSGGVKGLTAAILSDGSAAAVAYTLDTDGDDNTINDREIAYAVVDMGTGEVTRTVRATNDGYLDENPQLAAVKFPSANGEERFALGWYTEQSVASDASAVLDGGSETARGAEALSDIRLLDFDQAGNPTQLLPDSISQAVDAANVSITSDFRFTKNAETVNDLSILWVERAEGDLKALEPASGSSSDTSRLKTERDVLKGVKFYTYGEYGEMIRFTGAVDVAEMKDSTLIDHFDAYVSDAEKNEIKAVILGTTYGEGGATVARTVTLADEGQTQAQITVPRRTSAMYTATETYTDKIEVPAVLADYETVKRGGATRILFTVNNRGIHAIDHLEIQVGSTETDYKEDLNLLPGDSIQLYADYDVPTDKVVDPEYTVTAHFDETVGASGTAEAGGSAGFLGRGAEAGGNVAAGTIYLDRPDLEVTKVEVVKEEDGERAIQVALNNSSDAALEGSGRTVRLGFYSDATCEKPMPGMEEIAITEQADLKMIDNGGYSVQASFSIQAYLKAVNQGVEGSQEMSELPSNGVPIYIKAELLQPKEAKTDEFEPAPEPVTSNNYADVTAENLAVRTGKDAVISSTLSSDERGTTVNVTVQNTRYAQTTTGNLIVTLLDENGKLLAQLQSYTDQGNHTGLLTLEGEEKATKTFFFPDVQGAAVQVTYSDLILNTDNADLASLTFSNIPGVTLESFIYNEQTGQYEASVTTNDLTGTTVIASTVSGLASATAYSGVGPATVEGSNALSANVALKPGATNTITVKVVSNDNLHTKTYVLTVQNNDKPVISWGDSDTDATRPEQTEWVNPFVDVAENAWYYDAVRYVNENGLMAGTSGNTFAPDLTTTRGMIVLILYRLAGSPNIEDEIWGYLFRDVDAGAWYATAVHWARMNGIVAGYSDELFGPDDTITREQLATILYRYAQYKDLDTTAEADLSRYTDAAQAGSWATEALRWANAEGLVSGTSDTTLSPKGSATRAQVAVILTRFCQRFLH